MTQRLVFSAGDFITAENPSLTQQSEERIRERTYEILPARGDQEGNEVSDWFAALRELKESNQQQGKKARAAAVSL